MRIWWYILAAIFGFLAAVTVWLWPQKPLWTKDLPTNVSGRIEFVGDKLTVVGNPKGAVDSHYCRVSVSNAKTGDLEEEFELFLDGPIVDAPQMCPDLQSVFVEDNFRQVVRDGVKMNLRDWSIYDLHTGHRRYGPQSGSYLLGTRPWSRDGQWFCTTRRQDGKLEDFLQLRSFKTGEVAHEFPTPEGYHQAFPLFSPNTDSLCIFWEERQSNRMIRVDGRKLISIHDVPSGKEIKRIELPKNRYFWVRDWDGETLMIFELIDRSSIERASYKCLLWKPFQSTSIEDATSDANLGSLETRRLKEPLLEWRFGADWVATWEMVKPGEEFGKWYDQVREWLINQLKFDIALQPKWRVRCYSRSDGNLRREFPNLRAMPFNVSQDGRLLYTRLGRDTLTLQAWDLDPSPRWPWALLASLGAVAFILLLGSRRSKHVAAPRPSSALLAPTS
jgi:hypothetical protein